MKTSVLLPLGVLTAAAVAAIACVPPGSASAAPTGTFTLLASLDRHSLVTADTRPRGHSPADTVVFSAALRRAGKLDGRAEFVQTIVDQRYHGVSTHAELLLGDGTLELQGGGLSRRAPGGAPPASEMDMAIVGGTRAYTGATGVAHLVPAGRTTQHIEVELGA